MINCGTDIVKISRLEKALETPGFYEKVFGKSERAEFEKRGARLESLAAAFAAKEAFGKALGTGIRGFSLCEAEVLHKENGAPYLFCPEKQKPYRIKYTPNSRCRSRTTATMPRHL